jgi:hypothetical protein
MIEKVILIKCEKCGNKQQSVIRGKKFIGKSRKCLYCNKNITINEFNHMILRC